MRKYHVPALQDPLMNRLRVSRSSVSVILKSGVRINGKILSFDAFVIIVQDKNKKQHMIYKHAISTILPGSASIEDIIEENISKLPDQF